MTVAEASDAAEAARLKWDYRLIQAFRGNQTLMGAMVIAICGKAPNHPPRILTGGVISREGILLVAFEARAAPGVAQMVEIGPIDKIRDEFRRACDTLALPDTEREEFFQEFRKWIVRDWRDNHVMPDHLGLQ